jgi:hypothetical protein
MSLASKIQKYKNALTALIELQEYEGENLRIMLNHLKEQINLIQNQNEKQQT